MKFGLLTGRAYDIMYYESDTDSQLSPVDVYSTYEHNGYDYPAQVGMPVDYYNVGEGVYIKLSVSGMPFSPSAYIKIDTSAIVLHTINATAGEHGNIDPEGAIVVGEGNYKEFYIFPDPGYQVEDVTVDGESVGAVDFYEFGDVTTDHTIHATFKESSYTITAIAGANGTIEPAGETEVVEGGSQSYTITPDEGYHIKDVTVDGESVGAVGSHEFTDVNVNHEIAATFEKDIVKYTITASAGANGTISPAGATEVVEGGSQSYTITPDEGYHIKDVTVDGESVGAVGSHEFTDVNANHEIAATFEKDIVKYTITATADVNGTIAPEGATEVAEGESQSYTITAGAGHHIADVKVDGASVGAKENYTFENVTADHTIVATFAEDVYYTINATAGENGTIEPLGENRFLEGSSATYQIIPNEGYHIANVIVDGTSVGAVENYTFESITDNHTIMASFAKNDTTQIYTITSSAEANGEIDPLGEIEVTEGSSQTYTITPTNGYRVADVKVDGNSVKDQLQDGVQENVKLYTFNAVAANHVIAATFERIPATFSIEASAGAHGTIDPAGTIEVTEGESQVFAITPDVGYHIKDLKVDGESVVAEPTYTFNDVTTNHSIEASFEKDVVEYTITATVVGNGTIDPAGETKVIEGGSQSYAITADEGHHIKDILVDGVSFGVEPTYTFNEVVADHNIVAIFEKNVVKYTITATAGDNGTIAPAGATEVVAGDSQSYTIMANDGYHIKDVTVDGESIGAVGSHVFTDVNANHEIEATFEKDIVKYTITAVAGDNGTIAPAGATEVARGQSQSYTITPNEGYHIKEVKVDGESVGAVGSYAFTDVNANHEIEAIFEKDIVKYTIMAVAGDNGTIAPAGATEVAHGQSQSYTITPNEGYHIKEVKVDGESIGAVQSYQFKNVTSNHTISAEFEVNAPVETLADGLYRVNTALKNANNTSADSMAAGALAEQGVLQVVNGKWYLTAEFKTLQFGGLAGNASDIKYYKNGLNSEKFAAEIVSYRKDATGAEQVKEVKMPVAVNASGIYVNMYVDAMSMYTDAYIAFVVGDKIEVPTYVLTASAGANGTIAPAGETEVSAGESQTYAITANDGYHVADVLVDGESVGAVTTYTFESVASDHNIVAEFSENDVTKHYLITASAEANGSIAPQGETQVTEGEDLTITITPDNGYHIADVTVDGTSVGVEPNYTFNDVAADHEIVAKFEKDIVKYTITATADANGTIAPAGATEVTEGESQSYTITANQGYRVKDVTIDGASVGAVESYQFDNISANHTISATFEVKPATGSLADGVYSVRTRLKNANNISVDSMAAGALAEQGVLEVVDGKWYLTAEFKTLQFAGLNGNASDIKYYSDGLNSELVAAEIISYRTDADGNQQVKTVKMPVKVNANGVYINMYVDAMNIYANAYIQFGIGSVAPKPTYSLTATASQNGTIQPNGIQSVKEGDSKTFTITPNAGYKVADVTIDGASVGAVNSYTFNNITENHTINAVFANVDLQPGDSGQPTDPQPGDSGQPTDPQPGDNGQPTDPQPGDNNQPTEPDNSGDVTEDESFIVYTELKKAYEINEASMAAGALESTGLVEVVDGEWYLTVEFKSINFMGLLGSASDIKYYEAGLGSTLRNVEVINYRTDDAGERQVREVRIPVDVEGVGVFINMYVDAMEKTTDAYIRFDREPFEELPEDDGDLEETPKDNQTVNGEQGVKANPVLEIPKPIEVTIEQPTIPLSPSEWRYRDVSPQRAFYQAVERLSQKGILKGTGNDLFAPYQTVNRAVLVTSLYRIAGQPAVAQTIAFNDVAENQWYTAAVAWAKQNAIVNGYSKVLFGPTDALTKEQIVAILFRYRGQKGAAVGSAVDLLKYPDYTSISPYARQAMAWAIGSEMVTLDDYGRLNPKEVITRAKLAEMLDRVVD